MIATSWLAPASWQDQQEQAVREAIGAGPDWAEYVRLVDRHRTPALSWAALKRVPELKIPEPVKLELQKRSDACRMQAVRHSLILAEVLKAFNRAAIPVMPLKGPILSFDLYGDVGLRQSKDLDMACAPEDIARAQVCLESQGWNLESNYCHLTPRQWKSVYRHEYHLPFIHSLWGTMLELHWHNILYLPCQTAEQWARSIPSIWQGCAYQAMHPIDQVLYFCNHGGKHGWFRAKWLGDLAQIHAQERMDWAVTLNEARQTKQEISLLASLRLIEHVYGLPMPESLEAMQRKLPRSLIDGSLHALKAREEPEERTPVASFLDGLRMHRYGRLALSQRISWETLGRYGYCRGDFHVLHLPDRLFWAYAPLRPLLWLWRRVLHGRPAGVSLKNDPSAAVELTHRKP
jgi:hypothetical protein